MQEALYEAARKFPEYAAAPKLTFYLWLRHLTGLKLSELHVRHLDAQKRDVRAEVRLNHGGVPDASSVSLAGELVGGLTSPSQAAIKAELRSRIERSLDELDPTDREVLVLRHFEQLSMAETADVLGLSKAGAARRHVRAIKRLRGVLQQIPGYAPRQ